MTTASGNVGAAFGLVCVAGLASALGATVVFFPLIVKRTSRRVLAASLGLSAGVMIYVSFVEILLKGLEGFERAGMDETSAYGYLTLSFFGGVLVMKIIDLFVKFLSRYHAPLRRDIDEDIEITWNENEDEGCDANNQVQANDVEEPEPYPDALHYCVGCTADPIAELEHWHEMAEREIQLQQEEQQEQDGEQAPKKQGAHQDVSRRRSTMKTMKSSMTSQQNPQDVNEELISRRRSSLFMPSYPAPVDEEGGLQEPTDNQQDLHAEEKVAHPDVVLDETWQAEPTGSQQGLHEGENFIPSEQGATAASDLELRGSYRSRTSDERYIDEMFQARMPQMHPVPMEISIGASSKTVPAKNQGARASHASEETEERRNSVVLHIESIPRPQNEDGLVRAPARIERHAKEEKRKLIKMGLGTALAIVLHNFPEGLATFIAALEDPSVGAVLAVAIGIHNIPEGMFVALPIYYATGSRKKAFFWGSISGISEPVAAILGWLVLADLMTDTVYGVLFGCVGGIMTMISLKELIPTAHRYDPDDTVVTTSVIIGMAIMALSLVLFKL